MKEKLTIKSVQRGGDFQSITFSNGSVVYGSSEQDEAGNWIDSRGIDAIVELFSRGVG
jgi:hypothetical protein